MVTVIKKFALCLTQLTNSGTAWAAMQMSLASDSQVFLLVC